MVKKQVYTGRESYVQRWQSQECGEVEIIILLERERKREGEKVSGKHSGRDLKILPHF